MVLLQLSGFYDSHGSTVQLPSIGASAPLRSTTMLEGRISLKLHEVRSHPRFAWQSQALEGSILCPQGTTAPCNNQSLVYDPSPPFAVDLCFMCPLPLAAMPLLSLGQPQRSRKLGATATWSLQHSERKPTNCQTSNLIAPRIMASKTTTVATRFAMTAGLSASHIGRWRLWHQALSTESNSPGFKFRLP